MKRMLLIPVFIFVFAISVQAQVSMTFEPRLLFIGNEDVVNSGPSILTYGFGTSINLPLVGQILSFRPSIGAYLLEFLPYNGSMLPAEIEAAGAVWTPTVTFSLPLSLNIAIGSSAEIGLSAGVGFFLPLPVFAYDDQSANIDLAWTYFYSEGRFFYPESAIHAFFTLNEKTRVGLLLKQRYPVHHFWDGSDWGITHFLILENSFVVQFLF